MLKNASNFPTFSTEILRRKETHATSIIGFRKKQNMAVIAIEVVMETIVIYPSGKLCN